MNNYIVYEHICPNGKKYIGITKQNPMQRWNYGNGYKSCILFNKAIQKYGWKNIKHNILFENLTKEEAEIKEIELISKYKSNNPKYGYNICSGGNGTPSHCIDEKIRNKISKNTKEAMNNQKVKDKIIKAHLGKKLTKEHKIKISLSCQKPKTEEQKINMRKASKNKIQVKCNETKIIYDSIHEASRKTNISYQNIYKVCKGERKSAGGYTWQYEY